MDHVRACAGADVPAAVVPELSAPEPWPRLSVDLDAASPRLRAFLTGPLGACTFFTHHHEELCQHVLGPGDSITSTSHPCTLLAGHFSSVLQQNETTC